MPVSPEALRVSLLLVCVALWIPANFFGLGWMSYEGMCDPAKCKITLGVFRTCVSGGGFTECLSTADLVNGNGNPGQDMSVYHTMVIGEAVLSSLAFAAIAVAFLLAAFEFCSGPLVRGLFVHVLHLMAAGMGWGAVIVMFRMWVVEFDGNPSLKHLDFEISYGPFLNTVVALTMTALTVGHVCKRGARAQEKYVAV